MSAKTVAERERRIISLYQCGDPASRIAEATGCCKSTCYNVLRRHSVPRRDASKCKLVYHRNDSFFSTINTEVKAWVLGFLTADGYVCGASISCQLAKRDAEALETIRQALDYTGPLHYQAWNGYPGTEAVRLSIRSRRLVADLATLGVGERKSFTVLAWRGPEHLMPHYWRGILDGDGCISKTTGRGGTRNWTIELVGSRPMLESFAAFICARLGKLPKVHKHKSIWRVRIKGVEFPQALARILYHGATVSLKRKKALADELLRAKVHTANRIGRLLTFKGQTLRVAEWAARLGVRPDLLHTRLHYGFTVDKVLGPLLKHRRYELNGETLLLREWCTRYGMKRTTVEARLAKGWTFKQAVTTPVS